MMGLYQLHDLIRLVNKQASQPMKQFLSEYVCKSIISLMRGCANSDTFGLGCM